MRLTDKAKFIEKWTFPRESKEEITADLDTLLEKVAIGFVKWLEEDMDTSELPAPAWEMSSKELYDHWQSLNKEQ